MIVGEYERVDFEPLRDIPIAGFAPKGNDPEDIRRAFEPTKALIEFSETLLGPLPWPKYFQFAAPGIGGAMENISLVSWDSRLLFDANMHKDLGFSLIKSICMSWRTRGLETLSSVVTMPMCGLKKVGRPILKPCGWNTTTV